MDVALYNTKQLPLMDSMGYEVPGNLLHYKEKWEEVSGEWMVRKSHNMAFSTLIVCQAHSFISLTPKLPLTSEVGTDLFILNSAKDFLLMKLKSETP